MKNVLIIDAPPMFREFLKNKLSEEKVNVIITQEKRDALIKITSVLPDLVIIDINDFDDPDSIMELFQKIKANPNASRIPTIATGPKMDKNIIGTYAKLGIHKYFIKPIKFDIFFESIGRILHTAFSMDSTPCVLDIHRNNDIIFIEIAQGLNREKLSLLKYKLSEIIENNEIEVPKIILMMTNLELSFVDGLNLELLIDNILSNTKVHTKRKGSFFQHFYPAAYRRTSAVRRN
ncbi:MAG: response regulator [Treponema sp.]|nr:MAG: response regulator [Treponema sp.]